MKLNIGSGGLNLEGYINVDVNPDMKPDLVHDISHQVLPYEDGSIEEVLLVHTLEHIEREFHNFVLYEINRVLQLQGRFVAAFPEFVICSKLLIDNYKGEKQSWERQIFGRSTNSHEHHRCAMITDDFVMQLIEFGFHDIKAKSEITQAHNMFVSARKAYSLGTRETILRKELALDVK